MPEEGPAWKKRASIWLIKALVEHAGYDRAKAEEETRTFLRLIPNEREWLEEKREFTRRIGTGEFKSDWAPYEKPRLYEKPNISKPIPIQEGKPMAEEQREPERVRLIGKRIPQEMRDVIRELGTKMPIDFVEIETTEPGEPELVIETRCASNKVVGPADEARLVGEMTLLSCETIEARRKAMEKGGEGNVGGEEGPKVS